VTGPLVWFGDLYLADGLAGGNVAGEKVWQPVRVFTLSTVIPSKAQLLRRKIHGLATLYDLMG
jgi:hypothetical protein